MFVLFWSFLNLHNAVPSYSDLLWRFCYVDWDVYISSLLPVNRSIRPLSSPIKWIVQLLDITVGGSHAWSSTQQTITFFYQETRSISSSLYANNLFRYLLAKGVCFLILTLALSFLFHFKRKGNLESGITIKFMKRQFMETYTTVYLITWGELVPYHVMAFYIYLFVCISGWKWICICI